MILDYCGKSININRKALFSSRVQLGNNSGIGINATLRGKVVIGNDVMMGSDCTIYCRNHSFESTSIAMRLQGYQEEKPVTIEDDVWIGGHVIILPGVHIGRGVIVGAGAVVSKDVPPFAIIAGNPARIVKIRKNEDA